ncbi:MAG: hypothetical protein FWK04_22285 [Nostoc sp. GBBB01]|nr:hypothetical protein [Nostoc sp. GBBB01]
MFEKSKLLLTGRLEIAATQTKPTYVGFKTLEQFSSISTPILVEANGRSTTWSNLKIAVNINPLP